MYYNIKFYTFFVKLHELAKCFGSKQLKFFHDANAQGHFGTWTEGAKDQSWVTIVWGKGGKSGDKVKENPLFFLCNRIERLQC